MIWQVQCEFSNTPVSPNRPISWYALEPNLYGKPVVSIVTPFYNTGVIFHETARSVLQQSFQQWEWLIINDGSSKAESLKILDDYRKKDIRIRVVDHSTNQGPSVARNIGFREAKTKYVVQLDSDDLLEPTAIEKWFWFLESYPEYSFVTGYLVNFGATEHLWLHGFHSGDAFLRENKVAVTGMIRTKVYDTVGGYDETNRGGLEDWEFWLRCASCGFWGSTVPEYLSWYRRRPAGKAQWPNWHDRKKRADFHATLRRRYFRLWNRGLPQIQIRQNMPNNPIPDEVPCENLLRKDKRRLLMIVSRLRDKFNLDFVSEMTSRGFEITIAITGNVDHFRLPEFTKHTTDVFALYRFLKMVDYPRFLRYVIQSRQIDVIMISNSELGYRLLPYLKAHFPHFTFVDYKQEGWKGRRYARLSMQYRELLDLNLVSSKSLKDCMIQSGGDPKRIQVADIDFDPNQWRPCADRKWALPNQIGANGSVALPLCSLGLNKQRQPRVSNWRIRLYCCLRYFHSQAYHWALKHNEAWYFPVARRIKLVLLSLR
jgi:glycosyltransferase involved in cell wall biosynthesis